MQFFDCVVIGAGSGGVRAARMAAQKGQQVALVESGALGGTCVNAGCIPKKLYSYASHYGDGFTESAGYGWILPQPAMLDWERLKRNKQQEIQRLNGVYHSLLENAQVTIIHGKGEIIAPTQVKVGERVLQAKRILIATGAYPFVPQFPGSDLVITSDDIFDLPQFPQRLVVVGGGYIACELASIFHGLGASVTQLYRGDQVLRGFDQDVRDFITKQLQASGLDLRLQQDVQSVQKLDDGTLQVTLQSGEHLIADQVLYATGRQPNSRSVGFEQIGGQLGSKGEIVVNEYFQTNIDTIDAIGDVTGTIQLTPVALAEAMLWVDNHYGQQQHKVMDYHNIPTAVFTHPNIGTVGLTQAQAEQQFARIQVFRSDFKPLKHTLTGSPERCLMKLIVDADTDRVVGLHVVGEHAGEIVQGFAVAIKAGLHKSDFDTTVGIHPTAAEELVTMRTPIK